MDQGWNLDRKPTAAERAIGIGGAALLSAAGMAGLWFSAFEKRSLMASLVTGVFTALALLFLFRFLFSSGQKLQRQGVLVTAVVFTAVGATMFVGSFFASELRQRLFLLSLGVSGVAGGALNFSKAKKVPNQPPKPMPLKQHGSP